MLKGGVSSPGIALGKILVLTEDENLNPSITSQIEDTEAEIRHFDSALEAGRIELENLAQSVGSSIGEKEKEIFEAQALILDDPALVDEVRDIILREKIPAAIAISKAAQRIEEQFSAIEDETIKSRISDVRDVVVRIKKNLGQNNRFNLENLKEPVILVTKELLPSQAAKLKKDKILGIITERGGINNHASIIARSLCIPAVVGVSGLFEKAVGSEFAVLDGMTGKIFFDPEKKLIKRYQIKRDRLEAEKQKEMLQVPGGIIKTSDEIEISLYANVGSSDELKKLRAYGSEGIGVLRTEFLLMNRETMPTEDEITEALKVFLEALAPHKVNIRLLDIGADKMFPFIPFPTETNPQLGRRGLRFLLFTPSILKLQLRAIMRAGVKGNAQILLPMVTTLEECIKFFEILKEAKEELLGEGAEVNTEIPVGMMIETPSSAILLDKFIPYFSFFSIGTNDLTQYILASDRESEYVQGIYNSLDPAVLTILKFCCREAKAAGVEISICGEMASNIRAIPVLLGMGFTSLSLGVSRIPEVKNMIKKLEISKAKRLADKALSETDRDKTEKSITRFLRKMDKSYNLKLAEMRLMSHNAGSAASFIKAENRL